MIDKKDLAEKKDDAVNGNKKAEELKMEETEMAKWEVALSRQGGLNRQPWYAGTRQLFWACNNKYKQA